MISTKALLCGTPVVTRIRLLRDNTQALLVSHRETGLLVATTSGMIKALCEIIRDRVAYRHRATAARADLVNRFSMDALRMPLCDLVNSAAALNTRSLQDWCVQRFSSRPDVDKMFRLAMNAYGYRRFSAGIARLAHSPTLYRVVALTKHAKLRRLA